jgi:polysaccharide biosynthesis transport protein
MFDSQELRSTGPAADGSAAGAPAAGGEPTHLLDRLNAVFKHRRVAGTAFLLIVTAMMVQTYSTIPVYETSARVQIDDERSATAGLGVNDPSYWQDTDLYNKTQYQIIQSRELARRVVRKLDLQNNPDFNGNAPRPRDPLTLVRQARASASTWVRGLIARPAQAAAKPAPDETAAEGALIGAFLGGVGISPVSQTRLVDLHYRHTNPEFAALAANALADEYTQQNLDLRLGNTNKQLAFINSEVEKASAKVKAMEDLLTKYREDNHAQSLDERTNMVAVRLNQLNETSIRARSARVTKEGAYNQVKDADPKSDAADNFPLIGTAAGVMRAKVELSDLESQLTTIKAKYGPQMPERIALESKVAQAKALVVAERTKVIQSARLEYEAALNEERSFGANLEQAKADSIALDKKAGDYRILQRDLLSAQELYKSLLDQQKTLTVVASSRNNNVHVVDRADVHRTPIAPNPRRDWMTAILAGLTIAFGLAFGIEYLDDSVKTPEDITKRLKLPLLGLVPAIRGNRVPVLTETVPHDFGEAFRSLRTSLVFTSGGESTRVIAVTSSQPLEGKTTTAANLGMALALGGSRVLLIDADMRRPGLHKTIGVANTTGLSHLLVGQARIREVVQRTIEPNLFVISAGRTPPNPSELLASERMSHLIANLAHGPFDWVVIDTPPVLAVTDAVIIAQKVEGVVFVVGSEMTRRVHAERALATLSTGKVRGIGVVLNRVDFDRNKYYYSRYYGYQYKNYYGQQQNNVA